MSASLLAIHILSSFCHVELLCGMVVIADKVKPEARMTVHALHEMGLRVCMLTGDNYRTAKAIAQEVKIATFSCIR